MRWIRTRMLTGVDRNCTYLILLFKVRADISVPPMVTTPMHVVGRQSFVIPTVIDWRRAPAKPKNWRFATTRMNGTMVYHRRNELYSSCWLEQMATSPPREHNICTSSRGNV